LCGTILNRQKLVYCEVCGATIGPSKYLDYIRKRVASRTPVTEDRPVCEKCAREGRHKHSLPVSNL